MSVVTDGQTPQPHNGVHNANGGSEGLTRWLAFAGVGIGLIGWLLSRRTGRGMGPIFTLLTFGSALLALVTAVRGLFNGSGAGAAAMDYPTTPFSNAPFSPPSLLNTPAPKSAPSLQPITVVETKADNIELRERPKLPAPSKLKPIQGLLFVTALLVSVGLLLALPQREAGILLVVMVVAALGVAAYSLRQPMSGIGLEFKGLRSLAAYYVAAAVGTFNRSRRRNAFIFTVFAVLLMLQATTLFEWRGILDDSRLYDATRVAVFGTLAIGAAWLLSPARAMMPLFAPASTTFVSGTMTAAHWGAVGVSVLLLAALAEISGLKFLPELRVPMHVQFTMMVSGMILLAWGLSAAPVPSLTLSWRWTRSREFWLVTALTSAALALRFYQLGEVQWRAVDEILFVDNLKRMWGDPNMPMLQPMGGLTPFTWIYTYWQVPLVSLFGRNLVGFRAASVIIGALNVPALYFVMRVCFGKRVALMAALLLVGFPPHLHFSRIALNQVVDTLFGVLSFGFMARAMKHNRRSDYVIGGVLLGFTQYHYEGGRLFFPLMTIAWLGGITVLWLRRMIVVHWRGLALSIIAAVIVALPAYYTLWALDIGFTNRVNVTGLGPSYLLRALGDPLIFQDLLKRFSDTFHVMVHKPEASLYYGGPGPLILNFMVPFFLLGLAYCLWQVRKPGAMLLLGWVAMTMFGNALLIDTTHINHYEIGFPSMVAVTAVGIWAMIRLLLPDSAAEEPAPDKPQRKFFGIRQRRLAGGLAAVIGIAFTVLQVNYYFNIHLPYYNMQTIGQERDGEDVAIRAAVFPDGTEVRIVSPTERGGDWQSMLAFYNDGIGIYTVRDDLFNQEYIDTLNRAVDQAFFIAPQNDQARELLAANFELPEPQYTTRPVGPDNELVLYYIPADPAAVAAAEAAQTQ